MTDPQLTAPSDEFSHWVSDALNQLYDTVALQSMPLGKALFPDERNPLRRCQALRKTLLDAIHALEPGPGVPGSAPDRRLYRLVELRFIEGLDPNEAMNRLSLAKSQFYRDQARVVEMLAETLRAQLPAAANPGTADPRSDLIHAEVERLAPGRTGGPEGIDAAALAADLCQIVTPLAEDRGVRISAFDLSALEGKSLDRVLLRQALLTALIAPLEMEGLAGLRLTSAKTSVETRVEIISQWVDGSPIGKAPIQEQVNACRLLVEALGGKLTAGIESEQPLFSLVWPENRRRRLLVIDDNTGMGDLFRLYLKGTSWQVLAAAGGREARQILRENLPDLILLDILMPQEDGWELLRELKKDEGSQNIPVIICSVLKQPQLALKLGAAAYVEKPVSQKDLLEAVERIY